MNLRLVSANDHEVDLLKVGHCKNQEEQEKGFNKKWVDTRKTPFLVISFVNPCQSAFIAPAFQMVIALLRIFLS